MDHESSQYLLELDKWLTPNLQSSNKSKQTSMLRGIISEQLKQSDARRVYGGTHQPKLLKHQILVRYLYERFYSSAIVS